MSDTVIDQVIEYTRNKNPMIICDCCGMKNHTTENCMARGIAFQPPTICQKVSQYNRKYVPTTKVSPVDWKPKPNIDQHRHQNASSTARPKIKCTETSSTEQKLHFSDILSSLYVNYYPLHEHTHEKNTRLPCITYNNYD